MGVDLWEKSGRGSGRRGESAGVRIHCIREGCILNLKKWKENKKNPEQTK